MTKHVASSMNIPTEELLGPLITHIPTVMLDRRARVSRTAMQGIGMRMFAKSITGYLFCTRRL